MSTTYTNALIHAMGWTVVHSLWQALAIALVLSLALLATPRRLAKWRYNCASLALLLVLLCGGFTFYYSFTQALAQASAHYHIWFSGAAELQAAEPGFWAYWQASFTQYFNQHLPLIVTVWLCGLAFFMLRMLGGLAYIRQLRYQGTRPVQEEWEEMLYELARKLQLKRPVAILESLRIQTPLVIGHFKPLVLVPAGLLAGLSIDQVEAILAHELAHVYRRDYLLNLIQTLIEVVFYFNPGVWWISSCIRVEREYCCDDIAVALCNNNKLEYAKALVSIKEMSPGFTPSLAMAALRRKKHLLTRVQRILHQPINTSDMSEKIMVTALLAFVLLTLNVQAKRSLPQNRERAAISIETGSALAAVPPASDTLPAGKITIRTNRDGKRIEAKILDRKIQELVVDGKTLPATEYNAYEETLNEIIASVPPPPPPPAAPFSPGVPDTPLPPGVPPPPPPKAPTAPKSGYYFYHKGDDEIIIEGPKKGFGYHWKFDKQPGFDFKWDDKWVGGFDRSIIIDGKDSVEVAHFFDTYPKFRDLSRMRLRLDSMRIKLDTSQLRRMKFELGHLKEKIEGELRQKLGDQHFHFDGPRIRMDPDQFRFEMRSEFPGFKRFGSTRERIEESLLKDELIKPGGRYIFELTDKYLKIDGNKMPDALFEKYRRIYEESTGIKLENESKILLNN
jgi:beta-lactamase regulating signal transducer with metallopeptidase domain